MSNLLPLSVYENDPSFPTDPEKQDKFYENYFKEVEGTIKTKDQATNLLKESSSSSFSSAAKKYSSDFPDANVNDDFYALTDDDEKASEDLGGFKRAYRGRLMRARDLGVEAIANSNTPDTVFEEGTTKFAVRPFSFKGKTKYQIDYPNGSSEIVDDEKANKNPFAYALSSDNKDKFGDHYDQYFNKAFHTASGIEGAIGSARATVKNITQSLEFDSILNASEVLKQEQRNINYISSTDRVLKEAPNLDGEGRRQSEEEIRKRLNYLNESVPLEAHESARYTRSNYEGVFRKRKEAVGKLVESSIKDYLDRRRDMGAIKTAASLSKLQNFIQLKQKGEDTSSGFITYFKENPGEIIPWLASTVASSAPDVAVSYGSAIVGSAAAGPAGGAVAAGSWGYTREYTASLLESMESYASENNLDLSKPENVLSLLKNEKLINAAREKAATRAGVISAADAAFGAVVSKIEHTMEGAVKKAIFTGAADMVTESLGEAGAQFAASTKKTFRERLKDMQFSEIVAEGVGGLGASGFSVSKSLFDKVTSYTPSEESKGANAAANTVADNNQVIRSVREQALERVKRTQEKAAGKSEEKQATPKVPTDPEPVKPPLSDKDRTVQSSGQAPIVIQSSRDKVTHSSKVGSDSTNTLKIGETPKIDNSTRYSGEPGKTNLGELDQPADESVVRDVPDRSVNIKPSRDKAVHSSKVGEDTTKTLKIGESPLKENGNANPTKTNDPVIQQQGQQQPGKETKGKKSDNKDNSKRDKSGNKNSTTSSAPSSSTENRSDRRAVQEQVRAEIAKDNLDQNNPHKSVPKKNWFAPVVIPADSYHETKSYTDIEYSELNSQGHTADTISFSLPVALEPQQSNDKNFIVASRGDKDGLSNFTIDENSTGSARGTGLYFGEGEDSEVAKSFAGRPGTAVYNVDIKAGPDDVIELDKPLFQQRTAVWKKLFNTFPDLPSPGQPEFQRPIFEFLLGKSGDYKKLAAAGIVAGRYKEPTSLNGANSIVVYDKDKVSIRDLTNGEQVFPPETSTGSPKDSTVFVKKDGGDPVEFYVSPTSTRNGTFIEPEIDISSLPDEMTDSFEPSPIREDPVVRRRRAEDIKRIANDYGIKNPTLIDLLRSDFVRNALNIFVNTDGWAKFRENLQRKNYDEATRSVVDSLGITDPDKRLVLSNILTYWNDGSDVSGRARELTGKEKEDFLTKYMLVANALKQTAEDDAGIYDVYNYQGEDLAYEINENDLSLIFLPDEYTEDGSTYQGAVFDYGPEASAESLSLLRDGPISVFDRGSIYTPDKELEAKATGDLEYQPISYFGTTPEEIAANVFNENKSNERFPGGVVLKWKNGANGFGVIKTKNLTEAEILGEINEHLQGKVNSVSGEFVKVPLNEFYAEQQVATVGGFYDEYRVESWVDSEGTVTPFKLVFKKNSLNEAGNQKVLAPFKLPLSVDDPSSVELRNHIKQFFSKRKLKGMEGLLIGIDVGYADVTQKDGSVIRRPVIFELNPAVGSYSGMSGFSGNFLTSIEAISEFTGRPSILAALANIAKTSLSEKKIKSMLDRMSLQAHEAHSLNPNHQRVAKLGLDRYNPFIGFKTWFRSMVNTFGKGLPDLIKSVWSGLEKVVKPEIIRAMGSRYGFGQSDTSKAFSVNKMFDSFKGKGVNPSMGAMLDYIIENPSSTEEEVELARYFRKNGYGDLVNQTRVKKSTTSNSYYLQGGDLNLHWSADTPTILHEVGHGLTSNYIGVTEFKAGLDKESKYGTYLKDLKKYIQKYPNRTYSILATSYLKLLEVLGLTQEDGVGSIGDYDGYERYTTKVMPERGTPYGATNIHEMVTEAFSNESFARLLQSIEYPGGSSLLNKVVNAALGIFGIPPNRTTLYQSVLGSAHVIIKDKAAQKRAMDLYSFEPAFPENTVKSGTKAFDKRRITKQSLKSLESMESGESSLTDKEKRAERARIKKQEREQSFESLKQQYNEVLKNFSFKGTADSLSEARQIVIDHLEETENGDRGDKKTREQYIQDLVDGRVQAGVAIQEMFLDRNVPDEMLSFIADAYEHIINASSSPEELSLGKIKKYGQMLASLSDGGVPIGIRNAIIESFKKDQFTKLGMLAGTQHGKLFENPIANWRRKPFFGLFDRFGSDFGSLATQASELRKIAPSDDAFRYLTSLFSHLQGNVELQEVETDNLHGELNEQIKNSFKGKLPVMSSHRIGWVATLAQHDELHTDDQVYDYVTGVINKARTGLETRIRQDGQKDFAEVSKAAFAQVTAGIAGVTRGDQLIQAIEDTLSPKEKEVLAKMREIGQRYKTPIAYVSAVVSGKAMNANKNYVHRSVGYRDREQVKTWGLAGFNSMQSVLHDRTGIDPTEQWYESDINRIAQDMFEQLPYEKHTGIQRTALVNFMKDKGTMVMFDGADSAGIPNNPVITDRLKTMLGNFHVAKIGAAGFSPQAMVILSNAISLPVSTLIVGVGSALKNFFSSFTGRAIPLIEGYGHSDTLSYEMNKGKMEKFFKEYVPTQYKRLGRYEQHFRDAPASSFIGRTKLKRAAGKSLLLSMLSSSPRLGTDALKVAREVVSKLVEYSNTRPESFNAKSVWTTVYLGELKKAGKITSSDQFFNAPFFDKEAATHANAITDNALGFAARRESKGTFWQGDAGGKTLLANTAFFFRQQSTGLAIEAQTNLSNALFSSADIATRNKSMQRFVVQMSNVAIFRSLAIALSGMPVLLSLTRYVNSDDEEEKRKAIIEAEQKRKAAVKQIQIKDAFFDTMSAVFPIATSGSVLEYLIEEGIDSSGYVLGLGKTRDALGNPTDIEKYFLLRKSEIKKEIDMVSDEINELEKVHTKVKNTYDVSDELNEEKIEKLKKYKEGLVDAFNFKYSPSGKGLAAMALFGSYGVAAEDAFALIDATIGDDLTTEKKKKLKEYMDAEYGSDHPLSWNSLRLSTMKYLTGNLGPNPAGIVKRARQTLAEEALKKEEERERLELEVRKKYDLPDPHQQ